MPITTVRWVNGRQFVGTDSGNHSIVLSGDDPSKGVSPSEMLLVAVSACSGYDVVDILEKKRIQLSLFEVIADGRRDDDPPWPYRTVHLTFRLSGNGLTEKAVEQAVQLSIDKYCSVAATIRGVADITTSYEIIP